jgi:hypothetical protein
MSAPSDKATRIYERDPSTGVVKGNSPALAIAMWVGCAGFWLLMVAVITVVAWDKIRTETFLHSSRASSHDSTSTWVR